MPLNIFQYVAVALIALSGYAVGHILANFAGDEIKDKTGRKYFRLLRNISLIAIVFTLVVIILTPSSVELIFLLSSLIFILLLAHVAVLRGRKR